jgi:hypothetical protein
VKTIVVSFAATSFAAAVRRLDGVELDGVELDSAETFLGAAESTTTLFI